MALTFKLITVTVNDSKRVFEDCITLARQLPSPERATTPPLARNSSDTHTLLGSPKHELKRRGSETRIRIGKGAFGTVEGGHIGELPVARKSPVKKSEVDINTALQEDYDTDDHLLVGRVSGDELIMPKMDMNLQEVLSVLQKDRLVNDPQLYTIDDRLTIMLSTLVALLKGLKKLYAATKKQLGTVHAHRDIKPDNILIRTSGGAIKLSDFGESRAFGDKSTSANMSHHYPVDPNTEPLSATVDLWSLLVIATECFTEGSVYNEPGAKIWLFGSLLIDQRKHTASTDSLQKGLDTFFEKACIKDQAEDKSDKRPVKTLSDGDAGPVEKTIIPQDLHRILLPIFSAIVLPLSNEHTLDTLIQFYEQELAVACRNPTERLEQLFGSIKPETLERDIFVEEDLEDDPREVQERGSQPLVITSPEATDQVTER